MPQYGGHNPYPQRYGGSPDGVPRIEQIRQSLASQMGSAYSQDLATAVGIESMAEARAIHFDGIGSAERLSNQFVPATMTAIGLLPRWERIFQRTPAQSDTETSRRASIASSWSNIGQNGSQQPIVDATSDALGSYFVTFEHIDPAIAIVSWPGGSLNPLAPWYSTVAHVLVRVQTSSGGLIDGPFYASIGKLFSILDLTMPAWATWDWYLASSHGGRGFFLDEPDLDLEVFDV